MKVKIDFYCIQEKRKYHKGDVYSGNRKDIKHLLETPKKKITKKGKK